MLGQPGGDGGGLGRVGLALLAEAGEGLGGEDAGLLEVLADDGAGEAEAGEREGGGVGVGARGVDRYGARLDAMMVLGSPPIPSS